jgi:putative SOS response-associated peptidase YedK
MSGHFVLLSSGREIAEAFDLTSFPELAPRYNIAPTQPVLAVRAAGSGRAAVLLRWGLVAVWRQR